MGKKIKITEEQLKALIEHNVKEKNLNEGIGIGGDLKHLNFKNIGKGIKGMFSGEGYSYFRYLNILRSICRNMQKNSKNYTKAVKKLVELEREINASTINQQKKDFILKDIQVILTTFNQLNTILSKTETTATSLIGK